MNRLVDTSAWIEWFLDSPTGREIGPHVPEREQFVVPTIVQFELAKWLRREMSPEAAEDVIGFTQQCVVVDLDTNIAVAAADLARDHQLSAADAIIYATALDQGAELLTCDAHFQDLPGVLYFVKNA